MAHRIVPRTLVTLLLMALLGSILSAAPFRAVGVLGNSSGMSDLPVPYAWYTGIACDALGRLYLAGAAEGIPVTDQDGHCLAVLELPQAEGMTATSQMVRAGNFIFAVATNPGQMRSALYRIDTTGATIEELAIERITAGPGIWVLSPTLDAKGRPVIGQSEVDKLKYTVSVVDPAGKQTSPLFTIDEPKGATRPWRHFIQAEPDGTIDIDHSGGVNFTGRYNAKGERVGDALSGQIVDGLRYHFGYSGGLRRMDITDTKPAPGDCGANAAEIRMPAQVVKDKGRFFFAGRGGVVEAKWNGTNFQYLRRIGGIYLEDLVSVDGDLQGAAYNPAGNQDVQHYITISKTQPIGEMLDVGAANYSKPVQTLVPAPYGLVAVYREGNRFGVNYAGPDHLKFDLALPEVKSVGQAVVLGNDLLLADPVAGTIWRRPLMDKTAPMAAWKTDMPGVIGLATNPNGLFIATATKVSRLALDGSMIEWSAPIEYKGVRRLAATPDFVYVCDTAGNAVDQLDAHNGLPLARLGVQGEPGKTLARLNKPYAIAADLNGVYIADNGNGRVLVATTSLWRPDIRSLPRENNAPIVAVTIPIKPPAKGRMSLNIYDKNDVTVRQLVSGQPAVTSVTWDGRDLYGHYVKPGTYRYHGIIAPKFSLKYVGSIGQSGTPPYRTPDGKGSWGGVWGNVMDICPVTNDPDSDIVALWAVEEGEGGLIRMSQDGAVRWKQHLDWWMKASQIAVASDGPFIYIACSSAMNAPEGQDKYSGDWNRPMIWRVDAVTGAKKLYAPGGQQQPMFGEYKDSGRIVTDIAVRDGKLYLTAPAQNAVFVADAATGKELAKWNIANASGIAFTPKGETWVGSGKDIVSLDADGKVLKTVLQTGAEIWDIDVSPQGKVAVSLGAPRQQVVFDLDRDALGKAGGRPLCGKMDPVSFLNPAGLCITGNDKLFVAENSTPKRFTRWSADGKLEKEFNGPYYFSGMFGVDDEHPEYVYADTHSDLIRYKVDYQTGKWEVDHYWIGAYTESGVPAKWWPRIRHRDGKTYWCSGSGAIVELQEDHARGVAAVYGGWVEKTADGNYNPVFHTKKTGLMGTWSDLNGDGRKQPEEWQVTDKPVYPITGGGPQQGWGGYFDENFNLYMHDWSDDATGGVWKIPVSEWKNGVPVYRWDQAQHVGLPLYNGLAHGASGTRTAFAYKGGVYGFNGGYNSLDLPGVGHGHDWEFSQITKYNEPTGKPVWHAGERAPSFFKPGQMYCPTGPAGVINEYLFWTDENSLVHAWDVQRGLYVDTLLEDISRGMDPSPYTVWVELFNTRIFRHPKTNKVYLMAGSDAIHIFEVLGTEQKMARFQGQFTVTEADIEKAQKDEQSRVIPRERSLVIRRAAAPVKVDGELGEFSREAPARMVAAENMQAIARLLYDDNNLYVAFDVQDDSPWRNAGGDLTALFKSGDEVSVWLGPSAGKRQPGIGDVRILFAAAGGRMAVMAYRPKVQEGAKPVTFRSPAGNLTLDKVEEVTDVQVMVKAQPGGYRLEAAIPWTTIGLSPQAERLGFDLSVNYSDPAGQRNVARLHWGRNGAAVVYDLPTEARFTPENWGVAVLEK